MPSEQAVSVRAAPAIAAAKTILRMEKPLLNGLKRHWRGPLSGLREPCNRCRDPEDRGVRDRQADGWRLETKVDRAANRSRAARGNVRVAVRVDEIMLVEQILDVDLNVDSCSLIR